MIETKVFLTDIVKHGVDFVERRGRGCNNGELLVELRRYIHGIYIIREEDVDCFLPPIWERTVFELNSGFDDFGTKFIPSVNFNIEHFVEEAYMVTPEYWAGLRVEYKCAEIQE